jgi:hypothetical protein
MGCWWSGGGKAIDCFLFFLDEGRFFDVDPDKAYARAAALMASKSCGMRCLFASSSSADKDGGLRLLLVSKGTAGRLSRLAEREAEVLVAVEIEAPMFIVL